MYKKASLADQIASGMNSILESDEHKSIFSRPSIDKFAAKKSDDDDKDEDDKKSKKDKDEPKGKDDKKEDKKDKKEDKDKDEKKSKKAAKLHAAIEGIARISAALDDLGLVKSSLLTLTALDCIISEASDDVVEEDENACGDMGYDADGMVITPSEKKPLTAEKEKILADLKRVEDEIAAEQAKQDTLDARFVKAPGSRGNLLEVNFDSLSDSEKEEHEREEAFFKKLRKELKVDDGDANDISAEEIAEAIKLPAGNAEIIDIEDIIKSLQEEQEPHSESESLMNLLSELGDLTEGDLVKLEGDEESMAAVAKLIARNLIKAAATAAKK